MKRFNSFFVAAIALAVTAAFVAPAFPVAAQSSASLSIVPKRNYTIEAGKSAKDKLTIRNLDNDKTLDLTLRVIDFTYTDDGGTPKLMLDEDAPQTTWSLRPFMKVPKTVKIPPKSSKTIDVSVDIPVGHGAGSYYSAIVYSSGSPDGGNVGLNASGVTLAFVSIPGKVNEDLKLEKFGAYKLAAKDKKASYTSFTMDEPQNMAYTLKNNGNVTEAPVGSITIKDIFGREQTISEVNPNKSLALIGQTRTYTACIKLKAQEVELGGSKTEAKTCTSPGLWPGYYSAKLNLLYGQNGNNTKEIVGSASFWYMPLWFIIVLIVLVLAIAFGIWMIVRKVRNRTPQGARPKKLSRKK